MSEFKISKNTTTATTSSAPSANLPPFFRDPRQIPSGIVSVDKANILQDLNHHLRAGTGDTESLKFIIERYGTLLQTLQDRFFQRGSLSGSISGATLVFSPEGNDFKLFVGKKLVLGYADGYFSQPNTPSAKEGWQHWDNTLGPFYGAVSNEELRSVNPNWGNQSIWGGILERFR